MAAVTTRRALAIVALAAAVATVLAIVFDPYRALLGYLAAYAAVATIAIGALVLLLIGYATNARWLSALRRLQEAIASIFPLLAMLFLPIAFGVYYIYAWADPSPELRHAIAAKQAFLNPTAFIIRSVLYFAVFITAAEVLLRWSRRRDFAEPVGDPESVLRRDRVFAAAMLPPVALALTFAAFDWLMSLQPEWVSSMFPVYVFAGGFSAGIAVLVIVAARRRYALELSGNHFHALGRLLFAFVVFWTYTAYFQAFIIQIANRPAEVTFYLDRTQRGWGGVLVAIIVARFVLPFFLLLPRSLKKRPRYVTMVAVIVLVGHALEMAWLVVPSAHVGPSWQELAALVAIAGACIAFAAWRMRGVPLVVVGDPFLPAGLRYESPT